MQHPVSHRPAIQYRSLTARATTAPTSASMVRELDTPFSDQSTFHSVATPSCCCCCCCCLTATVVAPVFIGVSTNEAAVRNGRNGVLPGIAAGLMLPGSALLLSSLAGFIGGTPLFLLWLFIAICGIAAMRYLVGDSAGSSMLWGVLATVLWIALMIANMVLDVALVAATVSLAIIIVEVLLIPLWIWLIVRSARRRRKRLGAGPGYSPVAPVLPDAPPWPPVPPGSGNTAPSPYEVEPPGIYPSPRIEDPYTQQDPHTPQDPYTEQDPYG